MIKLPVFFTADTHFGTGYVVPFRRPFRTHQEMRDRLILNWNSSVNPRSIVYHLGDFGKGVNGEMEEIFRQLNGHKILIRGNHDSDRILELGWVDMSKQATITIQGQSILLSHKPVYTRGGSGWHLFGHVHRRLSIGPRTLNVGVDLWNYTPVDFNRISGLLKGV